MLVETLLPWLSESVLCKKTKQQLHDDELGLTHAIYLNRSTCAKVIELVNMYIYHTGMPSNERTEFLSVYWGKMVARLYYVEEGSDLAADVRMRHCQAALAVRDKDDLREMLNLQKDLATRSNRLCYTKEKDTILDQLKGTTELIECSPKECHDNVLGFDQSILVGGDSSVLSSPLIHVYVTVTDTGSSVGIGPAPPPVNLTAELKKQIRHSGQKSNIAGSTFHFIWSRYVFIDLEFLKDIRSFSTPRWTSSSAKTLSKDGLSAIR